ncbi:ABC transporter permease subunit [Bacillus sp. 31A1R]|uniref:ABC transporter permease subunit n=1 Tax=Robertmurraya mangrovi TaxID=3098077 RepID=A0ABU5J108_9BACI|nr:ABC transporter permease subunit [Bacillus sp. 31A1R]MDZ5473093.1 ABC transporter permease subunit [Bacillus sp. 31A1R]
MILLLNKMLRSLLLVILASFVIVYLVFISTDDIHFVNRKDWGVMFQAVIDYYRELFTTKSLGVSQRLGPIDKVVPEMFAKSLKIIIPAYFISVILGIILGLVHFLVRERKIQSKIHKAGHLLFGAIPDFFLLIAVQYGLILLLNAQIIQELDLFGDETLMNVLFPTIIISISPIFFISNITYHSLLIEKDKDYVRTALSKGTGHLAITLKHMLWNAWPTILSYTQTLMLIIISSLPIIERLCFYKGAGSELIISIKADDTYVVLGLLLPFLLLVLISIWITDFVKLIIVPSSLDKELTEDTISKNKQLRTIKLIYHFLLTFPYRKAAKKVIRFTKENPSFSIGVIILSGFAFMAFFGPLLPFIEGKPEADRLSYDENGRLLKAPLPPGENFWFGTDREGRDLLSIMTLGARETFTELVIIVTLRFMISIPFGYFASVHKGARGLLGFTNSVLSFLPTIILIILIGNMDSVKESYSRYAFLLMVISLLDIGRIGEIMRQEFNRINKTDYFIAAVSVGTSWFHIITRYYIPNIYQKIIFIFISDMARIMAILGGLGIVGVFLAQDMIFNQNTGQYEAINLTFTWPSLLANSLTDMRTAPWILFFPTLFIAITIIGLNLFGAGLKDFIDKQKNNKEKKEDQKAELKAAAAKNWVTNDSKEKVSV